MLSWAKAGVCEVCTGDARWRLERLGDVVLGWACDKDLSAVASRLQRDWETTALVVTKSGPRHEPVDIGAALDRIPPEPDQ